MPREDGYKNLKPGGTEGAHVLTPEERKLGHQASCRTKRRRTLIRDSLQSILAAQCTDADIRRACEEIGIDDASFADAIAFAMVHKGSKGDVDAARFVRDSSGERPTQAVELAVDERPVAELDLGSMSDEELMRLAEQRSDE